ncbi:MAG TPA: type II secretion system F family protein [Stellaceae bacterium]|nr:type II secretion system F family protein [Stellaceae bacterium]
MLDLSTSVLILAAALTLAIAGACLVAYNISTAREQLRGRVDLLAIGAVTAPAPTVRPSERDAALEGLSLLSTSGLHGDELEFARWLDRFKVPVQYAKPLFIVLRSVLAIILAVAFVLAAYYYLNIRAMPTLVGAAFLGLLVGWWFPHNAAERAAKNRRRSISRGLPDAIELLVIAVEAGLSLEDAMNRIVGELQASQPAVSEELAITSADLKILPNRDDALRRLADRVDMPSVNSIVTTLSQTLKYGTPLAQALRVAAAELRNDALLRIEEQANRMPVLLTVPMIVFILPSLFLIIGGPAFLKVIDTFSSFHH